MGCIGGSFPLCPSLNDDYTFKSTATARRSVGATLLNRESSRSHAVLTLTLRVRVGDKVREGKINLVDLAGSENNKVGDDDFTIPSDTFDQCTDRHVFLKLTGNDPSRMAESAAINKSLSVLGQVVHALNIGAVSWRGFLILSFFPSYSWNPTAALSLILT